jgi:hypothetical protein
LFLENIFAKITHVPVNQAIEVFVNRI